MSKQGQARVRSWIWVSIAAGLTACHTESPPEDLSPLPEAAPSPAALADDAGLAGHHHHDAGPTGPDAICTAVLKEEKLDESALREDDRTSPGPRLRCWSTGTFAWSIRVDRMDAGSSVRQTLIFAGTEGVRAKLASTLDGVEWPPALGRHAAMFDFDGDGLPEFFGIVPKNVRTFAPAARNFVTVKGSAIAPFPTGGSFNVEGLLDMDKDGRPDLRISYDVGKRTACQPGEEGPLQVELAAHSLPGGKFSVDDAAAASFAQKHCPALPSADAMFSPSGDPGASDPRDLSMSYVACERLRGKSTDAVIAELQAACAPNAEATKKCAGPCRHLPDAIAVAKFAPPLRLKDSGDAGTKAP